MISAAIKTVKSFAKRTKRESPDRKTGVARARAIPVKTKKMRKMGAECFVASASPSAREHIRRSFQAQPWKAGTASTTALAESSETGKSVITTGKWAATVGSIARKSKVPRATPGPNVLRTANVKNTKSNPFSVHMAIRARRLYRIEIIIEVDVLLREIALISLVS